MNPSGRAAAAAAMLFVLFLVSAGFASAATVIEWSPLEVECTIGDGDGPTEDAIVMVTSHTSLSDVDVRVVPELAGFVEVIPDHFDTMEPETPYEVRLRFSVAPGAGAGQYSGTVQICVGKRVIARPLPVVMDVDYGDIVIPPTTKVLSRDASGALTSIESTPQGHVLTFSQVTNDIAGLSFGDVLVSNVCAAAPMGFLGRVTSVVLTPGGAVVSTVPATLEDVISYGTIQLSRELGPDDIAGDVPVRGLGPVRDPLVIPFCADNLVIYDLDGDYQTTDDQIRANGCINVGVGFDFRIWVGWGGLEYLRCVMNVTEDAHVVFEAEVQIFEFEEEVTIGYKYFTPIVVMAGYVPLVFVPQLRAYAEFEGSASARAEMSVMQNASLSLGAEYDDGVWTPVSECSVGWGWEPPGFEAGCQLKASVGPQFSLLFYGLPGPYAEVKDYVELDVEVVPLPLSWELWGGIEAGAGVRVDLLGETIADWEAPTLVDLRVLLAESQTDPGCVAGQVTDAVTQQPLGGVTVDVLDLLGDPVTSGVTDDDGTYSVTVEAGSYLVDFSKPGYLTVHYIGVDVGEGQTVYLEPVLQIDDLHAGEGIASGHILNALSGAGVPGITLDLREGMNSTAGPVVASTVSGSGGAYQFSALEAGNYTAEAGGAGYLTTYFGIICIGGQETANQDAVITPDLPEGQTRIVLTWGYTPRDLDSHATGPLPDGTRFHMYYPYAESNYGSPWPEYVTLDLDDVTHYGPETTTFLQHIPGVYRFLVHDYTNRLSSYSTELGSSGALVRVYRDEGLVAAFPVPTGQDGTLWTVFEMESGTIIPINSMDYESSPSAIRPGASEDPFDWLSLPSKDGIEGAPEESVASLSIIQPNPFTIETSIAYTVPSAGAAVAIRIFDAAGRLVTTVTDEQRSGGSHTATWDGRDSAGQRMSQGIYFCRAAIGERNEVRKVVLLR